MRKALFWRVCSCSPSSILWSSASLHSAQYAACRPVRSQSRARQWGAGSSGVMRAKGVSPVAGPGMACPHCPYRCSLIKPWVRCVVGLLCSAVASEPGSRDPCDVPLWPGARTCSSATRQPPVLRRTAGPPRDRGPRHVSGEALPARRLCLQRTLNRREAAPRRFPAMSGLACFSALFALLWPGQEPHGRGYPMPARGDALAAALLQPGAVHAAIQTDHAGGED